jgi:type VI secretion system secreted protein VgrG
MNVNDAVEFVMRQEDSDLSAKVTKLPGDAGGPTRLGIASLAHPELVRSGFFDVNFTPKDNAIAIASQFYAAAYGDKMNFRQVNDQALATALLSFGIHSNPERSVQFMQEAATTCGIPLDADGVCGPKTLAAINSLDPSTLLTTFVKVVKDYYVRLVNSKPQNRGFIKGWLNRADAWVLLATQIANGGPANRLLLRR